MIRAAVLTISDSSAQGLRADASGPAVAELLKRHGFEVVATEVIPDERQQIAARLRELSQSGRVDMVVTTGGTGVSPRDVTPEAVREVLDKEIPGLGERMRSEGLKKTPRAILSRSLGGLAGAVLIVALPGSPKGAVESLDAIVELVPHILSLAQGETAHPEDRKRL